jgi:hypothetical protein
MNRVPPLHRDWGFWLAVVGGGILLAVLLLELMGVVGDLGTLLGLIGITLTLVGTVTAASRRSMAGLYLRIDARLTHTEDRLTAELRSIYKVLEEIRDTLRTP